MASKGSRVLAAAVVATMALAAVIAWTLSPGRAPHATRSKRPNVVLLSLDTTRRDHMSFHGYERRTTPHLRRMMADRGVVFDTATTVQTNTAPAHATMFTGLYPTTHGIRQNGMRLRDDVPTLAEILRREGYATGGFVSGWTLTGHTGLDRGFDLYDDDIPGRGWRQQRPAHRTWARTEPWLRRQATTEEPFFLFFHLFDPHHPYEPPPEYARRFLPDGKTEFETEADAALPHLKSELSQQLPPGGAEEYVSRYDGEIAYADEHMGELLVLLEELGVADDTLVILVADHGETLLDRVFAFAHGGRVYDEQVRIPLVLRLPGDEYAGRRVSEQVSNIDLMATVLDFLGVSGVDGIAGRSLLPLARRDSEAESVPTFSNARPEPGFVPEIRAPLVKRGLVASVRLPNLKLIEYPMKGGGWYQQLFDLQHDPAEQHDISSEHPEVVRQLHDELERWRGATGGTDRAAPPELSPEVEAALRALGYVE
ncbi:MAG: sulfatase [Myxococcota bacterium]